VTRILHVQIAYLILSYTTHVVEVYLHYCCTCSSCGTWTNGHFTFTHTNANARLCSAGIL